MPITLSDQASRVLRTFESEKVEAPIAPLIIAAHNIFSYFMKKQVYSNNEYARYIERIGAGEFIIAIEIDGCHETTIYVDATEEEKTGNIIRKLKPYLFQTGNISFRRLSKWNKLKEELEIPKEAGWGFFLSVISVLFNIQSPIELYLYWLKVLDENLNEDYIFNPYNSFSNMKILRELAKKSIDF